MQGDLFHGKGKTPCENKGFLQNCQSVKVRAKTINPHIFRHSIARYLKSRGFSAEWIQNFLGHASYKLYGTISIDEMQDEAERKLQAV